MKLNNLPLLIGLAALLLAVAGLSLAQQEVQQVAEISLLKGTVTVRAPDDSVREVSMGDEIFFGDVIETSNRSFAVITFIDDSTITLQPISSLDIKEFDDDIGEESVFIELLKGGLRSVSGKIGKTAPQNVTFKARTAMVGLRGTTFALRLCAPGKTRCEFRRAINDEGSIELNDDPEQNVRIFSRDPNSAGRRQISREEYERALGDTYAWVSNGAISVRLPDRVFDLETVRPCRPGELPPASNRNAGCEPLEGDSADQSKPPMPPEERGQAKPAQQKKPPRPPKPR